MKRAGLKCKPSKCEILRDSIKYLGRMVDRHGVRGVHKKICGQGVSDAEANAQ